MDMVCDDFVFDCLSLRCLSQWRTTRTRESPASLYSAALVLTVTRPRLSRLRPLRPWTTRSWGGRACSGHDGWVVRVEGAPAVPREWGAPQSVLANRDSIFSVARRDRNLTPWSAHAWNTWVCRHQDSVSVYTCVLLYVSFEVYYGVKKFDIIMLYIQIHNNMLWGVWYRIDRHLFF